MTCDIALVSLGHLTLMCPLLTSCALSGTSLAGQQEELKSPWLCVSTALQQLKTLVCYHHYF